MQSKFCWPGIMLFINFAVIYAPAYAQTAQIPSGTQSQAAESDQGEMQSILLSDVQLSAINKARQSYEENAANKGNNAGNEEDFLSKLVAPATLSTEYTYPQFFLSSIIYHSPEDWVIWINNTKITSENSLINGINLRILSVDSKKVVLEWIPQKTDKVDLANVDSDNNIKTDFMNNKVVFELHTNQTFTSYAMKIVEGNPPPISIKIQ